LAEQRREEQKKAQEAEKELAKRQAELKELRQKAQMLADQKRLVTKKKLDE
jgi:hypothetical protein